MKVEIYDFSAEPQLVAVGEIDERDAGVLGLICTDGVVRLSVLLWEAMIPEAKGKFSVNYA